ncbi:unnamed protein product [Ilex paraguariensis]|uniref:Uncharacterized protein n=1 Tax=Ilex paraguariensis TaxID=185542 RepID=A0ABC8TSR1_9AQUA
MDSVPEFKVLERCQISPPPGSVSPTSLPLTFFDIPWLLFPPNQPLFFYDFPHSTTHFNQTFLPALKHSLSLTLQHFFPLAGNLTAPPLSTNPHLSYTDGNSLSLIIAESTADFHYLSGHHHRQVEDFHHLAPALSPCLSCDPHAHPLLAIQVTLFPNCGICVGFKYHHVAADGRTFNNFLKSWTSICSMLIHHLSLPEVNKNKLSPCYDRSVIKDPNGFESILLREWWNPKNSEKEVTSTNAFDDMVRSTFVMGRTDMQKLKQWIMTRSKNIPGSHPLLLSPYVLTCSLVWVCLIKTLWADNVSMGKDPEPHYFGFIAGGITRLDFPVPTNYFGNCVGFGRSMAMRSELLEENGIVFAAKAIGDTIKKLDRGILENAENWIREWKVFSSSELHVMVVGSPKLEQYGLDFGWGKPRKIEEGSIDKTRAISLCECRDMEGGIEIGLALPKAKMDAFTKSLNHLF